VFFLLFFLLFVFEDIVCWFSTVPCVCLCCSYFLVCEGLPLCLGRSRGRCCGLGRILAAGCASKVLSLLSTCTYLQNLQVISAISELLVTCV
jgi:hypothetical protein